MNAGMKTDRKTMVTVGACLATVCTLWAIGGLYAAGEDERSARKQARLDAARKAYEIYHTQLDLDQACPSCLVGKKILEMPLLAG